MTKFTKAQMFTAVADFMAENAPTIQIDGEEVSADTLVTALRHEVELVNKRNAHKSSKPSKKDTENEALMERILSELALVDGGMTVSELAKAFNNEYSNQKISALMKKLCDSQKVNKSYEKRVARFSLA